MNKKFSPIYSPNGPTLEFEVVGDRNNILDLQEKFFGNKLQNDGSDLRYDATNAAQSDAPVFVNNTLHWRFSECTVSANGMKVSNSNRVYAHKAFIETEYSNGKEAKDTWLSCQGDFYKEDPGDHSSVVFTNRGVET